MSQLDLAIAAEVSTRHLSFLENGRSTPGAAMVMRLAAALDIPLRNVNSLLEAAGHPPAYPEPEGQRLPEEITAVLKLMKEQQEPYPLVAINRLYDVVDINMGAALLFASLLPKLPLAGGFNIARVTFDPVGGQSILANFDELGRELLWRVQREVLANPNDGELRDLLEELLAQPTVTEDWRKADLTLSTPPVMFVRFRAGEEELKFVTAVTSFQSPHAIVLDELRIQTFFPANSQTAEHCQRLRAG